MTTYRLYSGNGPALVGYSGPFQSGIGFKATQGGCWFGGYWWWVPAGGDTAPQKFALLQLVTDATTGNYLVPGSVVTSGTLSATPVGGETGGHWNFIALSTPVPLAIGAPYVAATGWTAAAGFPDTNHMFDSGGTYPNGLTNGPLFAYADGSGSSHQIPIIGPQGQFGTVSGKTDPAVYLPIQSSNAASFGIDVQISDTAPGGYTGSYRIWPNFAGVGPLYDNEVDLNAQYVLATEFALSQACTLDKIWFYSPPAATSLPTQCAIWDVSTQTMVAGTLNTSPSWSGALGSGWVSCSYSGVTLPAGDYKTAVWNQTPAGTVGSGTGWNEYTIGYFTDGDGADGIVNGPITVPNATSATSPGQSTYATSSSTFLYPGTYVATEGQSYWVDVEVTPVPSVTGTGTVTTGTPTSAGSGAEVFSGTGAVTTLRDVLAGTGSLVFAGTGLLAAPSPQAAGGAAETFTGTGALSVPGAQPAGSGGPPPVTGSGGTDASTALLAGTGAVQYAGPGGITLPRPALSGTGGAAVTGTGALTVPVPTLTGLPPAVYGTVSAGIMTVPRAAAGQWN